MNVVITGAAGFLGSHLAQTYLNDGHRVCGIDNFITSDRKTVDLLARLGDFTFIEADVAEAIPRLPFAPHLILHFASPASPFDYARDPLATLAVNGPGTKNCCEVARSAGARLVFASTSEVYGDPLVHPQPETYWGNVNSFGARSCYDESKRYGEAVVAAYRQTFDLDARIVRIFNTYGPRMRPHDGRVVPAFIMQALEREPLTVFGDGTQTRSLCYVDDLIDGITRFAALMRPAFPIVNLGSDHEVSVLEIAQTIARLCDVECKLEFRSLPPDDPARRRPDLTRAREMLKFEPRTSLEDGLRATIDWFATHVLKRKETIRS